MRLEDGFPVLNAHIHLVTGINRRAGDEGRAGSVFNDMDGPLTVQCMEIGNGATCLDSAGHSLCRPMDPVHSVQGRAQAASRSSADVLC